MKGYRGNAVRWTHEEGYVTTDKIIAGKLWRNPNPDEMWTIAYELEDLGGDSMAVKNSMVDPDTVTAIDMEKVKDEKAESIYHYQEVVTEQVSLF